ncbi:Uncharacterised protein [Raoultella terrigena]|uniref:Uncharacterized protein n=1 Tax=Raoultella terrigena TaxID=577 RepID=A0A4U9D9Y5_RAOTE|nr:Uncharacterised protein [Raoultella terrigena]
MFTSDKYDFIAFGGCHNGAIKKGDYKKFKGPDEFDNTGLTMLLAKPLVRDRDVRSNKKIEPISLEEFLVKEFLSRNGNTYLIATYDSFEPFSDERVEQIITVWKPRPYA